MVGDEVVLRLDVDILMKRYRDGLLGAQAVILVKKVGEEILAWQEHELEERRRGIRSEAPAEADPVDELVSGERDFGGEDLDDEVPARSRPPASARAWARKSSKPPADISAPLPPRVPRDLMTGELGGADASHIEVYKKDREAPDDGELDDDARAVIRRWTFEEGSTPRSRQGKEPDWKEKSGVTEPWSEKSGVAFVRSGRTQPGPRDANQWSEEDDEPRRPSAPLPREEAAASSQHRSREAVESGSDSEAPRRLSSREAISSSRAPASSATASQRPASVASPKTTATRGSMFQRNGPRLAAAGAALGIVVLVLFLVRPGFLFRSNKTTSIEGPFTSEHLRLAWRFQGSWIHADGLDEASTTKNGWQRHASVFFQGASPSDFEGELLVVTIEHGDRPTEEDLRTLGTAELSDAPFPRTCSPLEDGRHGQRCESVVIVESRRYSSLEEYFTAGPHVVFVHGLVRAMPPPPGMSESNPSAARLGNKAFDALIDTIASIEPFESK